MDPKAGRKATATTKYKKPKSDKNPEEDLLRGCAGDDVMFSRPFFMSVGSILILVRSKLCVARVAN